ncbi:cytochrome P450 [Ophiobolus disseminans]|uniref:Cytochrome P450 n=1 Tax=Ophiobolus disseminans TaxID=1469910 RepID=A0A6A7A329_9PLEO|nr:cytochrome P450 [Ophiobolus disseminans]
MEYLSFIALATKGALLAGILRCVVVWSYRITLHPLHKYPGPFFAKLTEWYGAYHALRIDLHLITYYEHQEHGNVVRCSPNKLVFNHLEAYQDIYRNERLSKAHSYRVTRGVGYDSIFSVRDKKLHCHKRKIVSKAVSEKSMRTVEYIMMQHIDTLIDQLDKSSKKGSTNMAKFIKRLGFDVVSDLAFGESLNLLTNPTYCWITSWVEMLEVQANARLQAPTIMWTGLSISLFVFTLVRKFEFVKLVQELANRRLEKGKHDRKDFFASMMGSKDPFTGRDTRMPEVVQEALFFLPAGGETTSKALCALFSYVSRYPECQQRLVKEVCSTFKTDADVYAGSELSSCKYLRACLDEAMYLSPPICGTLWRELLATDREPLVIDGHAIPEGTLVGVNIYSLHHNPKYFPDPFTFNLERWLTGPNGNTTEQLKLATGAFAAFSSGSKGCAGKAMAYMEASLVVCKILLNFDIDRGCGMQSDMGGGWPHMCKLRGRRDEYQLYDHFISGHDGPYLKLRRKTEIEGMAQA